MESCNDCDNLCNTTCHRGPYRLQPEYANYMGVYSTPLKWREPWMCCGCTQRRSRHDRARAKASCGIASLGGYPDAVC